MFRLCRERAFFVLGYIHYFQQDYTAAKSEFIYTLAWDKDHPQAVVLMDSILVLEAETEVCAVEKEEVEALEEEQKLQRDAATRRHVAIEWIELKGLWIRRRPLLGRVVRHREALGLEAFWQTPLWRVLRFRLCRPF